MADTPRLDFNGSRLFVDWLAARRASLALTTYQAGKLILVGLNPQGGLSVFER
ncbi:MAG: TIGR03032 family protein, partial [Roseovarius sp.]|nr:TIGR03032 family protein [Roseovarius sp.]